MERSNLPLQIARSPILRYGLAVVSVAVALAPALLLQYYKFNEVELPPFLLAVALTAWYAGVGPAVLSILLSSFCVTYFFLPPIYSFYFSLADLPSVIILMCFAALITWFSSIRRGVERELLEARDRLQVEVVERTQQASLLNLTHDTIFVRDLSDIITYWNRGAQELYGWTAEEAIGRRSPDLLGTIFPAPREEIVAEFLRSGRWEGELRRTTSHGT